MQNFVARALFFIGAVATLPAQSRFTGTITAIDHQTQAITINAGGEGIIRTLYSDTTGFLRIGEPGQGMAEISLSHFKVGDPVMFVLGGHNQQYVYHLDALILNRPAPPRPEREIEPFANKIRGITDPAVIGGKFLLSITTKCIDPKTKLPELYYFHLEKSPPRGTPCSITYHGKEIPGPCEAYLLKFHGLTDKAFSMKRLTVSAADRENGIDARAVFYFSALTNFVMQISDDPKWSRSRDGGGMSIKMKREDGVWKFDFTETLSLPDNILDFGDDDPDELARNQLSCEVAQSQNPFSSFYDDAR